MNTDFSWLDGKPVVRMLSTLRMGGLVVAAAIAVGVGLIGLPECDQGGDAEASRSGLRVVRASVTWREGGRELSVVHVAEPVQEAPRVVIEDDERRFHDDPSTVGREIRTGVSSVMMVVRFLTSGKRGG